MGATILWLLISGLTLTCAAALGAYLRLRQRLHQMLLRLPGDVAGVAGFQPLYRLRRGIDALLAAYETTTRQASQWQQVLADAPIGYLEVDAQNRLLWCNATVRSLLQIDRWQPAQPRLLIELVRSYELDQLIERTRSIQAAQHYEWVYQMTAIAPELLTQRSSRPYQIALAAETVVLADEHIGVFLQSQQPLVEAVQARDRTFSDLTHELRTPLTAIHLVTEMLYPRLKPPERDWVQQMLGELDRLRELVEDCLELGSLDTDPNALQSQTSIRLQEQIDSAWQTLEPLAQPQRVTLQYTEDPTELEVYGDPKRLMQVWFNLIDNALKHSPPGGAIAIQAQQNETDTYIDVIDQGKGFQPSDLGHVFERLYRGDPSRQRLKQSGLYRSGSGLGLSIVQQIIQAHGGTITAQNHPQQGAWLQIKLPRLH